MASVRLSDLIAPVFWPVWADVKKNRHTHYWLKGGRSSTKSSAISLFIILLIMQDPQANAVCFRKVKETLRDSVFEQVKWAIDKLGVDAYFKCSVSPMEITYRPTGQKILFRGVDDPLKIKSLKTARGYFKLAWFEELSEFAGMEEVSNVILSVMRGGGGRPFLYFYSYNPPPQTSNWVNAQANVPRADRLVVSSSYLDVPEEWLGEAFLREAKYQQKANEMLYRHIYLGEITGTGGAIFPNACSRDITDEEIAQFDNLRQGIDWGFVNDPFCFLKLHYDSTRRDVYIFEEIYGTGISNREAIAKVDAIADPYTPIYADSAEPKSIKEFKDAALYVKAADKGPGSVEYGIKFLQGLAHIYIDPDRCPNAWREFSLYELEKDRNGEWKREPPDKDNHCLAAGTQIITDKGLKAVEDIKRGDYVLTRAGYKKVLWGGISGRNMAVYEIKSSSGKRIKATAEHLVFTARGFVPVFELKAGDILLEAKTWQKSYTHTVAHGADTRKVRAEATESILKAAAGICTILYGNYSTARASKGKLYTTLTETAKTTLLKIWKRLRRMNIWRISILSQKKGWRPSWNFWNKYAQKPPCGTKAPREKSGTKSMRAKIILGNLFTPIKSVCSAGINLLPKTVRKSFAATNASPLGAGKKKRTMLPIPASIAERSFWQTNTQKGFFAASHVQSVTLTGTEKQVYDLTVEEQHEFFANGILVHNCIDSARYALCKDTLTW